MANGQASVAPMTAEERKVITASSLGTVFEWYDFYLYGSLAAIIGKQFFSGVNPTTQFIFALLAFAAGFAVRPFGAIVFGRLGDLLGRKYTFLITIMIMGSATFFVGILPSYETWGVISPVILIGLRLFQGLALGGEYGGAATYVAEHAPHGRRGLYTSWIQTTATVGLFMSLLVIMGVRIATGPAFEVWGWRIPFIVSVLLLGISVWIRLSLQESPAFQKMKSEGKQSKAPLTESFGRWGNLKIVLLSLFGLTAGQAVVWYGGMFYELFFLTQILKIDSQTANLMVAGSLFVGTWFFILFGWLSDKIGRKPIIMAGLLLAILTYHMIFKGLTKYGNPDLEAAMEKASITVIADPKECSFQFNPTGTAKFTSSCDVAKTALVKASVSYGNQAAPAGSVAQVKVGETLITSYSASDPDAKEKGAEFTKQLGDALKAAGYPAKADPAKINHFMVMFLMFILVIYVTMVYGPIAAMLVELFPTRIRYTSMSLPYHIGNGWFGGFLPTFAFAITAYTGNIYDGLWYPIGVSLMSLVIGMIFIKDTRHVDIYAND